MASQVFLHWISKIKLNLKKSLEDFTAIFISWSTSSDFLYKDLISGTVMCQRPQIFIISGSGCADNKHTTITGVGVHSSLTTSKLSVILRENCRSVQLRRRRFCRFYRSWSSVWPLCGGSDWTWKRLWYWSSRSCSSSRLSWRLSSRLSWRLSCGCSGYWRWCCCLECIWVLELEERYFWCSEGRDIKLRRKGIVICETRRLWSELIKSGWSWCGRRCCLNWK
jgi:hypothetical protein